MFDIKNGLNRFLSGSIDFISDTYKKDGIEKMDCLSLENILPWFLKHKEIYPDAVSGILMKFRVVQETEKTFIRKVRKEFFNSMSERGYIQILLDDQDREIKDEKGKMVLRYFEAKEVDSEIIDLFADNNIIRFD